MLGVLVAVGRAGERGVDLAVCSAHQLRGLPEDLLPAQTDRQNVSGRTSPALQLVTETELDGGSQP